MMLQHKLRSGNYDALLAAIAGFIIIQLLCSYGGIGVSPDSVVYLSTAQNIHDHALINDFTNQPVMDFPAFYPIFLSGILFLTGGGSVLSYGPILDGLLFGLLIWLCGWMMDRFSVVSRWYKWTILIFIVLSPCLLEIYTMIWSETLFLLLSVFFIIGCHRYFHTHSTRSLLLIGVLAGLACVTRYAGVAVVAMGGFLMLCDGRLRWSWRKIGHMALYGVVSISFLALNLYRNYKLTHTLTGYREKGLTPFLTNLHDFGSVFCDWLPFFNERYDSAVFVALVFLVLITGIFVYRLVRRVDFFSYDTIAITFFIVYGGFILYTSTVSRFQQLDSRLLSPLFLPWLWGGTIWIPAAIRRAGPRWKPAGLGLAAVAGVCFLLGEIKAWRENWEGIHYAGIPGYTETQWLKSQTLDYVRTHKDRFQLPGNVYSNASEGLWFLAGMMKSDLMPHKEFPEDIAYMFRSKYFVVIWFNDADNSDLIDMDYIKANKPLVEELDFNDGAIYFFKDSTAAPIPVPSH
ncbi:MAG: hypothetical protein JST68_30745 [Bacteroidetes bacterium]|nr:hypothetical protein [Bacteroidota bacterium]